MPNAMPARAQAKHMLDRSPVLWVYTVKTVISRACEPAPACRCLQQWPAKARNRPAKARKPAPATHVATRPAKPA